MYRKLEKNPNLQKKFNWKCRKWRSMVSYFSYTRVIVRFMSVISVVLVVFIFTYFFLPHSYLEFSSVRFTYVSILLLSFTFFSIFFTSCHNMNALVYVIFTFSSSSFRAINISNQLNGERCTDMSHRTNERMKK